MTRRILFVAVSLCLLAITGVLGGENRALAASFTVNSTVDAVDALPGDGACATLTGKCTLRAAIQETNVLPGSDVITLPAGTYALTLPGSAEDSAGGDLDVAGDLTIKGAGAARTIIDAGDIDRVFQIGPSIPGVSAEISSVTVQNGTAAGAGGISVLAGSSLTLNNSVVTDNTSGIAGGIGNTGTLTVVHSTVNNNSTSSEGGGIAGPGVSTIIGSTVSGNTAGGLGGGIAVPPGGTLHVSGSTVTGNLGTGGGGIAVAGELTGDVAGVGAFTLTDSMVSGNTSRTNGGGILAAGGEITNSTISGNTAVDGGGIFNAGTMAISGTTVSHNSAAVNGGGIRNQEPASVMTITDSSVNGNTSERLSGGIANGATLTVIGSQINGNSAGEIGGLTGGGIGNAGTVTLIESTVSDNVAAGTGGGIGSFGRVTLRESTLSGNSTGANGGAIAIAAPLVATNSTLSGNMAATDGGGISLIGTPATTLNNVTITANVADSDGNGDGDGGGVNPAVGTLSLSNTILAGNSDSGGEAADCSGILNSLGYNLVQHTSGCVIGGDTTGNITGQPAGLGPLANNGGLTRTHELLEGSAAIDAGNTVPEGFSGGCGGTDQRGVVRPQDGDGDGDQRCDIGAFEVQADEKDIKELPVAFEVTNSNTSGLACPSDGAGYTVRGHIKGPKRALSGPGPRVITLYLYGLETGEWNWRFTAVPGYDWPHEMAKAGHISLTIDQLGYGASGHPHGALTCLGSLADIAHQIVGQLRSGGYTVLDGGAPLTFQKVLLAGHDVGGTAAEIEAYSYKDIDGLIVMGWSEQGGTPYILTLFAQTLATECALGGQNPHDDLPGGGYFFMAFDNETDRAPLFDDMEPRVLEAALALKHKNPCGYLEYILEAIAVNRARLREVNVPVLLLYSNTDPVFARTGGVTGGSEEQPRHFTTEVTLKYAGTGHFPMLERTVDEYRGEVSSWLCGHGFVSAGIACGSAAGHP